jgi:N-ethylmaleimide reductase
MSYNNIVFNDVIVQFKHLIEGLDKMRLAYIHLMNNSPMFPLLPQYPKEVISTFGQYTNHTIIANGSYTRETGEELLQDQTADLISYGALFLANPDLPKRFELNAALNQAERATMFGGGEKGYTDYPFLELS